MVAPTTDNHIFDNFTTLYFMSLTLRQRAKRKFDSIVYQSPVLNKILRNVNKRLSFMTSFRLRPSGVLTVRLNSGVRFKMSTNETSTVTKYLFWRGADNYEYTRLFEKLAKKSKSFIDIGANIGYYSLLAGHIHREIKVYAFEPASAPFHFLHENIRINKVEDRVKDFCVALSNVEGEVEFFELVNKGDYHTATNLAGSGSMRSDDVVKNEYRSFKVRSQTLDNFIKENSIAKVDLVKMDTEGTENLVLLGASEMLSTHRPIIICETLFNTIEDRLEEIMLRYGYEFFNYKDGKLYKTKSLIRKEDNGVRDCFFVHPDKRTWVDEFVVNS